MDTLSSSISSSLTNGIPKSTNLKKQLLPTSTKPPKLVSNKTTANFSSQYHFRPPYIHSSSRPSSPLKHSRHRPSTGYAVALLDAARRHNAVEAVHRDVKRLSRWLRVMGDAAKGEMVKEAVKQGRFEKHLVKLVNLLADKAKVDLLGQVLSEFGKIYDELSLSPSIINEQLLLLLLPCGLKMEEKQIMEIVGNIQSHTGAHKVTVRKLVDPSRSFVFV